MEQPWGGGSHFIPPIPTAALTPPPLFSQLSARDPVGDLRSSSSAPECSRGMDGGQAVPAWCPPLLPSLPPSQSWLGGGRHDLAAPPQSAASPRCARIPPPFPGSPLLPQQRLLLPPTHTHTTEEVPGRKEGRSRGAVGAAGWCFPPLPPNHTHTSLPPRSFPRSPSSTEVPSPAAHTRVSAMHPPRLHTRLVFPAVGSFQLREGRGGVGWQPWTPPFPSRSRGGE